MLTYESASELLQLNLEEEAELRILSEAAALRLEWRRQQVVLLVHSFVIYCLSSLRKHALSQVELAMLKL